MGDCLQGLLGMVDGLFATAATAQENGPILEGVEAVPVKSPQGVTLFTGTHENGDWRPPEKRLQPPCRGAIFAGV